MNLSSEGKSIELLQSVEPGHNALNLHQEAITLIGNAGRISLHPFLRGFLIILELLRLVLESFRYILRCVFVGNTRILSQKSSSAQKGSRNVGRMLSPDHHRGAYGGVTAILARALKCRTFAFYFRWNVRKLKQKE